MGAGNPTISGETETQVRAACQPRQPHTLRAVLFSFCDRRKCTSSQFISFTFMNNDPKATVDLKNTCTV